MQILSFNKENCKKPRNWLIILLSIITLCLLSTPLFTTPTFDLDEALYRQSAQEMKQSHNYFKMTWSGEAFYEKPPFHMWTIVATSYLIDRDAKKISIFASKLPSVISTYLTLIFMCIFWFKVYKILPKYNLNIKFSQAEDKINYEFLLLPALLYSCTFLATAGCASVLIDPMLQLAFSPFFLFLSYFYIKNDGKLTLIPIKWQIIMILSLSLACMLKGPIGLLLPIFSIILHKIITAILKSSVQNTCWQLIKIFLPMLLAASIISACYYYLIYCYAGIDFIYNFFIVQNFHRALHPMEHHGGNILYHWLVIFVGGLFLSPLLIYLLTKKKFYQKYNTLGYPLSWCLSFILFFSLMSTKLPNYTWPVWMGLSILTAFLLILPNESPLKFNKKLTVFLLNTIKLFLFICPITICICCIFINKIILYLIDHIKLDYRAKIVLNTILPLPRNIEIYFIIAGIILLLTFFYTYKYLNKLSIANIAVIACLNISFISIISLGIMPFVTKVYWSPFVRMSSYVETQLNKAHGSFASMGLNSPTLSSSFTLFKVSQYLKDNDEAFIKKSTYIVLPKWLEIKCKEYNYEIIKRDYHLSLCKIKDKNV